MDASVTAATYVNTGVKTHDKALHESVRQLARDGIDTVTYKDPSTGRTTVRNQADVAVRRHIRTQLSQDGERRTEQLMDDAGVEFVEVSSHTGARPSHQDWQGRVYSRNGRVTVDGVTYEDFGEATGYYGEGPHGKLGDRLGGVNCRHSHGPWFPGMPRHYGPDPRHPSGLPDDEVYRLAQGQRARERGIRATKRELAAAQRLYDADPSLENRAELAKLQQRLRDEQKGLRDYITEANARGKAPVLQRDPSREWAGDMPKVTHARTSGRSLDDFLDMPGTRRRLKANGMSVADAKAALRGRGGADAFEAMTASEQQDELGAILARRKPTEAELRRAAMRPIDDALYNSQRNYVERHGGVVMRGGEEAERHLATMGVDAAYVTGAGVIFLHESPTTSEVLEEVSHFQQDQRGDYADRDAGAQRLLRERDAQRFLLSVAERYNIPESETQQTKDALAEYLRLLKEAGIDEGG